jgi:DNA-binding transcriptional regulator YdaS (Cro superfamily)
MTRHFDVNLPAASKGHLGIKRETAEICRERAAADLLASAAMINANQRMRLETSAATWTMRALMLQRAQDGISMKEVRSVLGGSSGAIAPD